MTAAASYVILHKDDSSSVKCTATGKDSTSISWNAPSTITKSGNSDTSGTHDSLESTYSFSGTTAGLDGKFTCTVTYDTDKTATAEIQVDVVEVSMSAAVGKMVKEDAKFTCTFTKGSVDPGVKFYKGSTELSSGTCCLPE